jgi:hypothetical protein
LSALPAWCLMDRVPRSSQGLDEQGPKRAFDDRARVDSSRINPLLLLRTPDNPPAADRGHPKLQR